MSEWKECVLGDIVILHYGKALRTDCRNGGNAPVYSSAGLTGTHDEPLVNNKGLIVGRKGTVQFLECDFVRFLKRPLIRQTLLALANCSLIC